MPFLVPMSPEQVASLRAAGWQLPAEGDFPNFWHDVPEAERDRAAAQVEALAHAGGQPDGQWSVESGRIPA